MNIYIIGLGLIGSSIARAIRKKQAPQENRQPDEKNHAAITDHKKNTDVRTDKTNLEQKQSINTESTKCGRPPQTDP